MFKGKLENKIKKKPKKKIKKCQAIIHTTKSASS